MSSSTARGVKNPTKAPHSWFLMPCLVLTCRTFWAGACTGAKQDFMLLALLWCCADSQQAEPGTLPQAEKFQLSLAGGLHMAQSACRGKIPNTASSGRTSEDFNTSNCLFWARPSSSVGEVAWVFVPVCALLLTFYCVYSKLVSLTEFISLCKLEVKQLLQIVL